MSSRFMLPVVVCASILAVLPSLAMAQARYEVRNQEGAVVGLFEFTNVIREEGNFASSQYFDGARAVQSRRGMRPVVRSHVEMGADFSFVKYTRWESTGANATEYKVFPFRKDIKMRVARGDNARVAVLGRVQRVFVIEPDQPYLAYIVLDPTRPEYSFACINTKLNKIGQATVKYLGARATEAPAAPAATQETAPAATEPVQATGETAGQATAATATAPATEPATTPAAPAVELREWRIEGDCGNLSIWSDAEGNYVRFQSDTRTYNLIR